MRLLSRIAPPVIALMLGLLVWHFAIQWFDIPKVLLPSPAQVAGAAWQNRWSLLGALWLTAAASLCGFLLSLFAGVLISMLFSQSRFVRSGLFPYAIFLQTVPIVAIAPLIVIWVGEGFLAVVIIAFIISLFPVITNGTAGMLNVSRERAELFALNNATRWQTLFKLRLPGAMPDLVTGARISSGLSVLGAIVGEYFAGAGAEQRGLGYLIFAAKDQFQLDTLFAAVFLCTVLGVVIFTVVGAIGQYGLLSWRDLRSEPR